MRTHYLEVRFLFFLLVFILSSQVTFSQGAKLKKAQRFMETLKYQEAIDMYQKILEKEENEKTALAGIAEAYRKLNDHPNAEYWYAKLVSQPSIAPVSYYYYGLMLQRNGKCPQAKEWFQRFLQLKPYDERRKNLQRACEYQKELLLEASHHSVVKNIPLNGPYDDLGPAFYGKGIVYASVRAPEGSDKREAYFDLYYVKTDRSENGDSFQFGTPEQFSNKINSSHHEAIVSFNKEETEIFFTRNQEVDRNSNESEINRLEIMSSKFLGEGSWGELKPLPFNREAYSVAHPAISPDGERLFFSSDMPGGFGGKDLYVSFKDGDSWSAPINLGPTINLEGDELYPFYSEEGVLYFSSDSHFGLGGQDIYKAKDLGDGEWESPENMGYPINSEFDDFGLIIRPGEKYGFFTSNRLGGQGEDDIYSFEEKTKRVLLRITEEDSDEKMQGILVQNDCYNEDLVSNVRGIVEWSLEPEECCMLRVTKEGYTVKSFEVCYENLPEGDSVILELPMEKEPSLTIVGVVKDRITKKLLDGTIVKLLSDNCDPVNPVISDSNGQFSFQPEIGCCYKIRAEKGNYFSKTLEKQICVEEGMSSEDLFLELALQPFMLSANENQDRKNEIVSPSEITELQTDDFIISKGGEDDNSISFLLNLYYDYGRTSIRAESVDELFKLLALLEDNPNIIVEISSHTDSRGSDSYNQKLSQRRADNIVRWLISKDIDPRRLVAKGYGEEKPVNHCVNDVPCSEGEYLLNRRTEFKVLGTLD